LALIDKSLWHYKLKQERNEIRQLGMPNLEQAKLVRRYLSLEPCNEIRRSMLKKGLSFMVRRWPWMMPILNQKFPAPTSNKVVGCRKFTEYVTSSLRTYP
jgi:hypothetical protein